MSVFLATPYSLTANTIIAAQVQAKNAKGWGALSLVSTGDGFVQTVPLQMTPVSRVDSTTTVSQITVLWSA